MAHVILGFDVGGSSIKAGLVDLEAGGLKGELKSISTPQPATPERVVRALGELDAEFGASGPVGFAFPAVVRKRRACTAANVDHSWLSVDGAALLEARIGRPVAFLNDADAAGLAEMRWGAGRDTAGTVIMLTFGTGIGTALFVDGKLLPNTELGHLELHGVDAEVWASARTRKLENLDWPVWAARVNEYVGRMHALFWPDVFILGGAVTENYAKFGPLLSSPAELRPAQFTGQAGVIGAALAASTLGAPRT